MVSSGGRQAPRWTAAIVLLGAAAVACPAWSQLALQPSVDRQSRIVERIGLEEAQSGPHSEGLIGPLSALAVFHQENGDHQLAVATIERVLQVVRANYGLRSLEQAPLIRQLIVNEQAAGNVAAAWDLDRELLTLARRHPEDLRTVPILREIADERLEILQRYLDGERPLEIVLGCYYEGGSRSPPGWQIDGSFGDGPRDTSNCHSGGKGRAARALLADAVGRYEEAITVIVRNELYSSDVLRQLELEILRTIRLTPQSKLGKFTRHPALAGGFHRFGRRSLERLLDYEIQRSAPPLRQIEAIVRLADWDLLHGLYPVALREYELAHRMLETLDGGQASIERIFAPDTPVVLPTLEPNPLAPGEIEEPTGHIDVAFQVTHAGTSRRIKILDTTTNASDAAKDRLVKVISRSRFRPQMTDGRFARRSPVVVRYYVAE